MPDSALDLSAAMPPVRKMDYRVGKKLGHRARIGAVILASDETLEHEFRVVLDAFSDDVAVYHARIENSPEITPETLRAMEGKIADTARLLLPQSAMDVVAYGCTSASVAIGPERVSELLHQAEPTAEVTNPATAAVEALRAMGVQRLAILTPYQESVNVFFGHFFAEQGFDVTAFGSFLEDNDATVASIDPESVSEAVIELGRDPNVDGVFVACTSTRLLELAAETERQLGKPVTSSNHAIIWHSLRLGGIDDKLPQFGKLYEN